MEEVEEERSESFSTEGGGLYGSTFYWGAGGSESNLIWRINNKGGSLVRKRSVSALHICQTGLQPVTGDGD